MITSLYHDGRIATNVCGNPEEVTQDFMSILAAVVSGAGAPDGFIEKACEYMHSEDFARRVKEASDDKR